MNVGPDSHMTISAHGVRGFGFSTGLGTGMVVGLVAGLFAGVVLGDLAQRIW